MKRKSRLIRCTRWALHSAPSPPSVSVFQSQTRHASLFSSWKRGKAEWEKRSESRVQVLGLQTIPSINHTQCIAPHHEHWVFARTNQAFRPQVLRVPACTMRAGLASKSKFVLIKKKKKKKSPLSSCKLYPNCFSLLQKKEISNVLSFVSLYGTLQSQFNRHFLRVYDTKTSSAGLGERRGSGEDCVLW